MLSTASQELLVQAAAMLQIELSDTEIEKFVQYEALLQEWNRVMNLTAVTSEEEVVIKHFVDSFTILPYLRRFSCKSCIDIGTGAGFPGIPVKILCPDIEIVLLDSLEKRVRFLNEVIAVLQLDGIHALHMRAEDGGRDKVLRERFDCAAARAVAPMNVLLEYCIPFIKTGGHFIAMKGSSPEEPYSQALQALNCKEEADDSFTLPKSDFTRRILCIKKTGNLSTRYPRKAGIPRKNPL